jgi:LL-diaminopimelate aminotransferase
MRLAQRVANLPPYVFAGLEKRVNALRAQGMDIIRLDMGSPDLPPPQEVIDALYKSAQDPTHHGYAGFSGVPALRQAMAAYYDRRFGVKLDPNNEVLALIGSKEGIVNIHLAFIDPGDVTLVPDPGYSPYTMGTYLAGGSVYSFPLLPEKGWLPNLEAMPADALRKAKLIWLNYPNNPTGATADLAFFERAVAFARKHDLLLCHDAPYCDVGFDGYRAPSLLQIPGSKDVAVEFNSLSKSHNLAGWRVGMAVGNAQAVQALGQVKSNIDSGIFRSVQDAAISALMGDQEWTEERNGIYQERRDIVLAGLRAKGLKPETPRAGLYVWTQIPAGYTSATFATHLMEKGGVSLTPGTAFGPQGEGYVRISLGLATPRVREAMERVQKLAF